MASVMKSVSTGFRSITVPVQQARCIILSADPCYLCVAHQRRSYSPSPFRNPDTRVIQSEIDNRKQAEFLDMEPLKKKQSRGSQDSFFDNVDIPPSFDTLGSLVSPYVKPNQRKFLLTPQGIQQRWEGFKNFVISTYSVGIIKRHVKPFPVRQFAAAAETMYLQTNDALIAMDKHALRDLTTANVSYLLRRTFNSPARVLTWKYLNTVERPRVVQARVSPLQNKENFFAQVTVRIHTEHIFSLKNRYGRLLMGSDEPRKAVEYVVFERHIVNPYGQWRICGKMFADDNDDVASPAINGNEASVPVNA